MQITGSREAMAMRSVWNHL